MFATPVFGLGTGAGNATTPVDYGDQTSNVYVEPVIKL
jgi:hypothetical protein